MDARGSVSPASPQAQPAELRDREALSHSGSPEEGLGTAELGFLPFLSKILGADFLKNDFIWTVKWDKRGKDVCKCRQ